MLAANQFYFNNTDKKPTENNNNQAKPSLKNYYFEFGSHNNTNNMHRNSSLTKFMRLAN